jgi:2',3'-cyclic-nucleotide 2'-phosphodiesterase (5'-nucleotidase family)
MTRKIQRYLVAMLALLLALGCASQPKLKSVEAAYIEMSKTGAALEDSAMLRQISPYKTKMEKEMNEIVAVSSLAMVKGDPEGLLGNFVADLTLKKTNEKYSPSDGAKADICMLNNGGLRTALPKGEITRGKVFELMPFDNTIVVLTMSGEKTWAMIEYIAAIGGAPVSGITMGIKDKKPVDVKVNGVPFDIGRTYKVVTSDYLANGGDKMNFFKVPIATEVLNYLLRDAIIEYMREEHRKGNLLKAELDRRIYHDK